MPCNDFLAQLREAHPRFEAAGVNQVTISGKSASMAKTLQAATPFPLLLDPDHTARAVFSINDLSIGQGLSTASAKNYAKAIGTIRNFAVHPSDALRTPAVVILNADQQVVWTRVGKALGDYPTIEEITDHIPTS